MLAMCQLDGLEVGECRGRWMYIQGVEPGSVDMHMHMLATSVARAGQLAVHGRQCRGCSEPRYTDWSKGDERRIAAGSQKTVEDEYTIVDNQLPRPNRCDTWRSM